MARKTDTETAVAEYFLYLGFDGAHDRVAAPPGARGAGGRALPRHLTVRG